MTLYSHSENQTCRKCGVQKPIDNFYFHRQNDRYGTSCKLCVCERVRNHRDLNDHVRAYDRERSKTEVRRAKQKRYWARLDPEIRRVSTQASRMVGKAIKSGVLVRPDVCSKCGETAYCEAAHHDYSEPLDVRWLCRRCHRKEDARDPKRSAITDAA